MAAGVSEVVIPLTRIMNGASATNDDKTIGVVPRDYQGKAVEYTFYVVFDANAAAGTVLVESSHDYNYSGTWATEATVNWAAASSAKVAHITALTQAMRVRVSSTITSGTVSVYVLACLR